MVSLHLLFLLLRIRKTSRSSREHGFLIHPSFAISLNIKDKDLIQKLHGFFGVGRIKEDKSNNAITFYVNGPSPPPRSGEEERGDVEDLLVIIDHFDKYSLLTQKRADFVLFKQAVSILTKKEHLTNEGLIKLIAIKA